MKAFVMIVSCLMLLIQSASILAFEGNKIEKYLDAIIRGHVNFKEYEKPLSETIKIIEQQLKKENNNPFLWYLKGRSTFAALTIRSVIYGIKDKRYKELQKILPNEYEKALALNKNSRVLTEAQLNNIYGSLSVNVEAARQYISLKKQKTTLDKREHLRLLRETIIPLLIKQSKFDEALTEMDYIDKHFPEKAQGSTGNIAWRKHFEKEIEVQRNKVTEAAEQKRTTKSTDPQKVKSATSISGQQPIVKTEGNDLEDEAKKETDNNEILIIGIVLAILLLVGFMAVKRMKK